MLKYMTCTTTFALALCQMFSRKLQIQTPQHGFLITYPEIQLTIVIIVIDTFFQLWLYILIILIQISTLD
jgi:hypothetical protein